MPWLQLDAVLLPAGSCARIDVKARPRPAWQGRCAYISPQPGAFNSDVDEITEKQLAIAFPIACVRIDVDDFKNVNDTFSHAAGDEALKHIAAALRKKARIRDRLYRVGGDEFGAILIDCTEEEAFGLMKRVATTLQNSPVRWVSSEGKAVEFTVSTSVGVAECSEALNIKAAFEAADLAAYASKEAGKKTVTRASAIKK
jgi:diguanylate cyclase (GGDEF)-like protein